MSQVFWCQRDTAPRGAPALFLDRDGVVVEEVGYLHRVEDVRLLPGAAEVVQAAQRARLGVGLVTNQAGIGRGYYGWDEFRAVQDEIARQLGLGPEPFDFVAACGAHPDASVPVQRIADHAWRKPNPGMLQMARLTLGVDLGRSVLVGDQMSDLQAGRAAGVGRLVHVRTGHGAAGEEGVAAFAAEHPEVVRLESLSEVPAALGWR
jgi:D-glycero-D-manno-heptose 1,7-bisphosphate phosphatase